MDADSGLSHSPPPAARRVKRTYGRPKAVEETAAESFAFDPDTSSRTLVEPSSSNTTLAGRSSQSASDDEAGKKPKRILDEMGDPDTRSGSDADEHGDGGYQFEWRKTLIEIDEAEDVNSLALPIRNIREDDSQMSDSMPPATLDASGNMSTGADSPDFSPATLPPLTQSPSQHHSQRLLGAESSMSVDDASPVRHGRAHSGKRRVIQDSDSEEGGRAHASRPAVSPSRSPSRKPSVMPSGSEDEEMIKPSKLLNKGKSRARNSIRNVSPLMMEEVDLSSGSHAASGAKTKRDTRSRTIREKKKLGGVKKPTKKEVKESRLEQARLMADRDGRIASTTKPLAPLAFLSHLGKREESPEKPIPPSDPIQDYSSPALRKGLQADSSILEPLSQPDSFSFGSPSALLPPSPTPAGPSSPIKPRGPGQTFDIPALAPDSDEDLPSVDQIMKDDDERREKARRQQELQDKKLKILEMQKKMKEQVRQNSGDEEDELVVAQDDQKMRKPLRSPRKKAAAARIPFVPSKRKEGAALTAMEKKKLDKELFERYEAERQAEIKKKEEDWVRRGGKIKDTLKAGEKRDVLSESYKKWQERQDMNVEDEGEESDGEWRPDEEADENARPQMSGDEHASEENDENARPEYSGEEDEGPVVAVAQDENDPPQSSQRYRDNADPSEDINEDEEQERLPPPHRRARTALRTLEDSEEEEVATLSYEYATIPEPSLGTLSAASSLPSTSDDEDKENNPSKVYDGDEDKENKAVPALSFGSSPLAPLFASRGGETLSFSDEEEQENDRPRTPFKVLSKGDDAASDDPFTSPPKNSALASPIQFGGADAGPAIPISPRELKFKGRDNGFSQFSDNEGNGPEVENDENAGSSSCKPAALLPAFSEFFEPTLPKSRTPSQKALGKRRAVEEEPIEVWPENQSDDDGLDLLARLRGKVNDEVPLTIETGLQPALEVDESRKRDLDAIFEKEQEAVVQDALGKARKDEELYVNEYGFLTQTKPAETAEAAPEFSPTQSPLNAWFRMKGDFSLTQSSMKERPPLGTLALDEDIDPTQPGPLRRLRKLDSTEASPERNPVRQENAFEIMRRGALAKEKVAKRKLKKSEFIEGEAEESDEDAMFGLGKRKADDDEEGDDSDDDKPLEGLVDDAQVEVQEELVIEKYKEHQEEDDQRLEQIHKNAVEGKYRHGTKRRDNAFGSDDSESEDEDRPKVKPLKRRKIDGDTLDELQRNPETLAFFNAYQEPDDEPEFAVLQEPDQDAQMDDGPEADAEEEEEPEVVTHADIQKELRAAAKEKQLPQESFDPQDADWIDRDDDDDLDDVLVREVKGRAKATSSRKPRTDLDAPFGFRKPVDPELQRREQAWAAGQKQRGQASAIASAHGATVTGFGQSRKSGKSSKMAAPASGSQPGKLAKKPSMLPSVLGRKRSAS